MSDAVTDLLLGLSLANLDYYNRKVQWAKNAATGLPESGVWNLRGAQFV
jgi:hypothetical protein